MGNRDLALRTESRPAAPAPVSSTPLLRLDYEQTLAARRVGVVAVGLGAAGILATAVANLGALFTGTNWLILKHSSIYQVSAALAWPVVALGSGAGTVAAAALGAALIWDRVRSALGAIDPGATGRSVGVERAVWTLGVAAAGWAAGAAGALIAAGAALWVTRPRGTSARSPAPKPALIQAGVPALAFIGTAGPGALTLAVGTAWRSFLPGVAAALGGHQGRFEVFLQSLRDGPFVIANPSEEAFLGLLAELSQVSRFASEALVSIAFAALVAPLTGLLARALRRRFPGPSRLVVAGLASVPALVLFGSSFSPESFGVAWYSPSDPAVLAAWQAAKLRLSLAAAAAFLVPHLAFAALEAGPSSGATAALPGGSAGPDALEGADPAAAAALPEAAAAPPAPTSAD